MRSPGRWDIVKVVTGGSISANCGIITEIELEKRVKKIYIVEAYVGIFELAEVVVEGEKEFCVAFLDFFSDASMSVVSSDLKLL